MTIRCHKCGNPLAFVKKLYKGVEKSVPVNPDGSDHWDLCRGIVRTPEWAARRMAEEAAEYPSGWRGTAKHVWCGPVAPWDESLGEYRAFTPAEIAEGMVCQTLRGVL